MEILCFYAGIAFIYLNKSYSILLLLIILIFRFRLRLIVWFLGALVWGTVHNLAMNPRGMPNDSIIPYAQLSGSITSLPTVRQQGVQFQFSVERLNRKPVSANVLMACYANCPKVQVGEHWQCAAKLKRPRNFSNPGGFDYVGWLSAKHIQWQATIRSGSCRLLNTSRAWGVLTLRESLANKLARLVPETSHLGIIEALTLGMTHHIDKSYWDLFRRTGTIHLIDISGSHISLIAGLTFLLVRWLWSRFGVLCVYCPAAKVSGAVAILVAGIYTLIAGFAVPAQRALFSAGIIFWRFFRQQRFMLGQAWRYALGVVLFIEPHAVTMIGFYLSFIGVGILMLAHRRFPSRGLQKMLILQMACLIGLMPLTLYWFSYGALSGMIANMLAIPLVELWIVPLALWVTFLPPWTIPPGMMWILSHSLQLFLMVLHWIDRLSVFNITFGFNQLSAPLALLLSIATAVFLPLRRLLVPLGLMSIAALFPRQLNIPYEQVRVDVMDVGQGLAMVINTHHHVLIYDTGVKFFNGSDMGQLVLTPYLRKLGISRLNTVIISHPDNDHYGGLASLETGFDIDELIVDAPEFYRRGVSCHQHAEWEWDGVHFRFFALPPSLKKNDHSCILQISTATQQLLLTGDIEQAAEAELRARYGAQLRATVMLVPHHGSKTSSSLAFVKEVSPKYAIMTYGFDNRYHFPHQQTLKIYQQLQIKLINTVDCGMVTMTLGRGNKGIIPQCYKM